MNVAVSLQTAGRRCQDQLSRIAQSQKEEAHANPAWRKADRKHGRPCSPARALKASRASMASGSSARSSSGSGSGSGSGSAAVSLAICSASSFSCALVFLTRGAALHHALSKVMLIQDRPQLRPQLPTGNASFTMHHWCMFETQPSYAVSLPADICVCAATSVSDLPYQDGMHHRRWALTPAICSCMGQQNPERSQHTPLLLPFL